MFGPYDLKRVGVKGHQDAAASGFFGPEANLLKNGPMTPVNAIEGAAGDDPAGAPQADCRRIWNMAQRAFSNTREGEVPFEGPSGKASTHG